MNTKMAALGCLMLAAATVAPAAFAHTDAGAHPFASTNLQMDALNGGGLSANAGASSPPASSNPAGWYTGAAGLYLGADVPAVPNPNPPPASFSVDLLFAVGSMLCDMEVLDSGAAPSSLDEGMVDGIAYGGNNAATDGLFNDGGSGGACHTDHYAFGAYNTLGCPTGSSALANDAVVGGEVWLFAACDWQTPTSPSTNADLISLALSAESCTVNSVLVQNPDLTCADDLVACALDLPCLQEAVNCTAGSPPPACPAPGVGATFACGADGVADGGSFGEGDGADGAGDEPSLGVPYPSDPCGVSSTAAVFTWAGVNVIADGGVTDVNVSAPTHGWIA